MAVRRSQLLQKEFKTLEFLAKNANRVILAG